MTDTIGWGDVDVDSRRRRRLPRVPRRVVWPTAAVVVAAVVLTPRVESHLADSAAGWLQRQWATATALDVSRVSAEQNAATRLGVGDLAVLAKAARALDREEVDRLGLVLEEVARHRTWNGDIHRAAVAVRAALNAEISDLALDSVRAQGEVEQFQAAPTVFSAPTQERVARADALVGAMAHKHHAATSASKLRLASAVALEQRLSRVVDTPVDVRLAISHDGAVDVWDLRTGTLARTVALPYADEEPDGTVTPIGDALLVGGLDHPTLLMPGANPVRLPRTPFGVSSAGGDGVWDFTGDGRVLRFDANGHRVGPAYALPAGTESGSFVATADAIVVQIYDPSGGDGLGSSRQAVWFPATGRQVPLTDVCDDSTAAAEHSVGYLDCARQSIHVLDLASGSSRSVRLPAGYAVFSPLLLARDGRRVAVQLDPGQADGEDDTKLRLGIADLKTGKWTLLRSPSSPLAWAADGSTLLVSTPVDSVGPSLAPLGYWQVGRPAVQAIRLDGIGQPLWATLLP